MQQNAIVTQNGDSRRSQDEAAPQPHGVRILVADDDAAIRESVRIALEDAGYDVGEAKDGVSALAALRADTRPTVVLLDLRMPNLDGAGVLGIVAADRVLSTRHAYILMSASLQTLTLPFATLLTQLDVPVIKKPFELDALLDAVERAARRVAVAGA
jgi:CheY-like chemotaxis protein